MTKHTYLITGPSGAGKTAVAELLATQGVTSIDADSTPGLCYFVNKNNKPVPYPPHADTGWWTSHNYIFEIDRLAKLIATHEPGGGPVFVSGNAGNIAKAWDMFETVFYLDIPSDLMLSRTKGLTNGENFGQRVDDKKQLVGWAEPFKEEMVGLGAVVIDATKPLAQVTSEILAHAKKTAAK